MAKAKRTACAFLAAFLLILAPVRSYGAATAVVTAGGYAVSHILAACGILLGTGAAAVLIGTWDDADTYRVQGAAGKLGAYAQHVYDGARDAAGEAMEKYQKIEETLTALVSSKWGNAVSGIRLLVEDLKVYCTHLYGYGYSGQFWHVPAVPVDEIWNVTQWSSTDCFPLPTTPAALVPAVANDPDFTLYLTSYCVSPYGSAMNIQNWYYANTLDIFEVYDQASMTLTTYQRNAENSTYTEYAGAAYSAYVYEDGTLKYNVDAMSYWYRSTVFCVPADAGALPFPVFGTLADAENYVSTGAAENTYEAGAVPMQVDAFREDLAALDVEAVSDVLTLPQTEDAAAENMASLEAVYPGAAVKDVEQVLSENGLAVTITDVPVEGEQTIPGQIADVIEGILAADPDEAEEKLSLPAMMKEKFPFCIPFDFIHLVKALAAEREVPRFEIPLEFHYGDFHYSELFIVDMSMFDPVVSVFRVMLDLLFCAGLIAATRSLIRG